LTPWNANGSGGSGSEIAPSDVDQLAAFAQATGWKVLYGIGCFKNGNTSGSTPNTAANAASEAAYVANALKGSLWAFEIGNEPNHYNGNTETISQYESIFNSFTSAIKAQVPGAVFAGPGPGHDHPMAIQFASDEGSKIIALTDHYYVANAQGTPKPTIANLINPDTSSNGYGVLPQLHSAQTSHGIPQWRMTEANSFYNGGVAGLSDGFVSALWGLDYLYEIALNGGAGVCFHGGTTQQFGLSGTLNYSPIGFGSGGSTANTPQDVRPLYYGELLFTMAGQGTLHSASVSGSGNITAYGIGNNVIIVNKTSSTLAATVTVPSAPQGAQQIVLTAPSATSTSGETIGGSSVAVNGAVAPVSATCSVTGSSVLAVVPGNSAALILTS
ncbi:MAG TPA: hypothetical protein VGD50_05005, partial [Candidatus Baltobacteraceae bacterium]